MGGYSPHLGTTLETPLSPYRLVKTKSFMKIRSAVPENGCLFFYVADGKNRKRKKTSVKHIRIGLIGGCVNKAYFTSVLSVPDGRPSIQCQLTELLTGRA